jgi:hypothetical protein
MRPRAAAPLLASLALAGCSSISVVPSGSGVRADPKPADCLLEFLPKPPERAFDELGDLTTMVMQVGPGGPLESLHAEACALGADAVIVTRNFVTDDHGHVLVAGTAIKFIGPERPMAPQM